MNFPIKLAKVKFIFNNGVTQETVVRDFTYDSRLGFNWNHHTAYPSIILIDKKSVSAVVILEVFDQQPCDKE